MVAHPLRSAVSLVAWTCLLPCLAAVFPSATAGATPVRPVQAGALIEGVRHLASDELAGRATGQPGGRKAADYIAAAFKAAGLDTLPGLGGYLQEYTATISSSLGPDNVLAVPGSDGQARTLKLAEEWIPFGFSAPAGCTAPVLFAGYGITAPEYKYDDYAGLDVKGKIVLALRHEPQENDTASVFQGARATHHSEFRTKARNAAEHGAAGIIIVTDPLNHGSDDDDLVKFGTGGGSAAAVAIPAAHVTRAALDSFWGAGLPERPRGIRSVQEEIDREMKPVAFPVTAAPVRLSVSIVQEKRATANVVGYLPPTGGAADSTGRPVSPEHLVIGAHYDHLGLGGESSLVPDTMAVHNGADDNASGVAVVMELARVMASDPAPRSRGVVFAAFSGEEIGLLGSTWYTGHPPLPLERAVAMINMDMVGRMKDGHLQIGGIGTSPRFRPMLDRIIDRSGLKADYSESGYGPSDHMPFYAKDRPVLFFFTGVHEDYHRPSDDWEKINVEGLAGVAGVVLEVAEELTRDAGPVLFVRAAADSARPAAEGSGHGYGVYLGTVPDFSQSEGGYKVSAVRPGSPAEQAGLRGGDVIVSLGGRKVNNLYDLTDELRAHRPGDVVAIEALRGNEKLVLTATLGRRR